jgi:hypothetical protein
LRLKIVIEKFSAALAGKNAANAGVFRRDFCDERAMNAPNRTGS